MYIRRFAPADADAVVRVSELATRITSGAVYDAAFVEEMVSNQDRAYFLTRGEQMHFYVACEDDGTVIGCAAFGPYHKNPAEGCFYSVFVLPEKQRRGVGRALIETIERDPMFLRAPRAKTSGRDVFARAARRDPRLHQCAAFLSGTGLHLCPRRRPAGRGAALLSGKVPAASRVIGKEETPCVPSRASSLGSC